jgi:demethylmenaquinone methyltransferase/2-methoxy-6-polyprenyl-1,4-benzoquinol methylase
MLDIATGTGDFAILAAKMLKPDRLIGADISEGMMRVGEEKVKNEHLQHIISFAKEDCLALSFADNTFDAVTAAFGIRNFQELERGLREMCRVLRPEGHLCIVELTRPVAFPMRQLFWLYSHTVLPLYGRLVSKDKQAYRYLISTIEAFPQGERMVEILTRAGFSQARFKRLTFGICTMYLATK